MYNKRLHHLSHTASPTTMVNEQRQGFRLADIYAPRTVILFCLFWAWLGDVASIQATEPTNGFDLLVGTYTSGKSKGIYSFRFNADTGDLQPLASPAETVNPSYLVALSCRWVTRPV